MIISDRFEVGYLGGTPARYASRYEALIVASELLRSSCPQGLAVIDRYAAPGMPQMWAVVDGRLRTISRKED